MVNKRGTSSYVIPKGTSKNNKIFWIGFITLLLISTAVILIETPSITGGASVQTISFLKEGSVLDSEIKNIENVKSFKTTIVQDTKNSKIFFEDIDSVSWNFEGKVLSMFKISSTDEKNYGSFEITLKIKEKDLQGILPTQLTLYHEGKELETDAGLREDEYIYYKARSASFGEFLIGKIQSIEMVKESIDEIKPKQPAVIQEIKQEPVIQEPAKIGFLKRLLNSIKEFLKIN
jgi:hypothetical protein